MNLNDYLEKTTSIDAKEKLMEIINWILKEYPMLHLEIKWNQPMIIMNNTHIISFSMSKEHLSLAPEFKTMEKFRDEITKSGYTHSKMLFRIKYKDTINYQLLTEIIYYNMNDKAGLKTFWR